MSFSLRNIKRLESGIKISMPPDENGLTGRECPKADCLGYFKVKFGTGLKGENLPCHCPYCGHTSGHDHFWTQEQLEYARSIMMNEVSKALKEDVKDWDRSLRQSTRNSFIKLSMEFKGGSHPIHYYREKQLETHVICDACTLEYAIYGVFAFCPDCGIHNSLQILDKNLELVKKEIKLAQDSDDMELAKHLIDDGLENAVSAFDGFGRATCSTFASKAIDLKQAKEISFQNIDNARKRVQTLFGFDLAFRADQGDWDFIIRCFQKRHLLAHTMGVVDDEYIKKTHDPQAIVGRKIRITPDEITRLIELLKIIGNNLFDNLQ